MLHEPMTPSNVDVERALLGLLLNHADLYTVIADQLAATDFYRHAHQSIYEAMQTLYGRGEGIDLYTVNNVLRERNIVIDDEQGGMWSLEKMSREQYETFVDMEHLYEYVKIVTDKAIARRGLEACGEAADAFQHLPPQEALTRAEMLFFDLGRSAVRSDFTPLSSLMSDTVARVREMAERGGVIPGIKTGFHELDFMLGGLRDEKLIIIAGRPGMGKTSLCLTIAHHAASKQQCKVGILSLEMSKEELVERLIAVDGRLDARRVSSGRLEGDEWNRFLVSSTRLESMSIYIDDAFGASLVELKSKAKRLQAMHGLDLLIVDYLQLMQSGAEENENEVKELSLISRGLKGLARELQIPVVALAQLNRAVESRQVKIPQLSDLRGSGTIEQDADVVLFVYREEEYNQYTERKNQCDIIVAKQRNGPKGTTVIGWEASQTRFYPLEMYYQEA